MTVSIALFHTLTALNVATKDRERTKAPVSCLRAEWSRLEAFMAEATAQPGFDRALHLVRRHRYGMEGDSKPCQTFAGASL
jgi:hypothetical protein